MKYRRLGKTDLRVSVVGLGTDQFSGEWAKKFTESEVKKITDRAHNLGINLIDTAECYGDHLSEALIGKAISHNRKDWIIATKFGHKFHDHLSRSSRFSPADVMEQLSDSLKALGTNYIDIYQFHSGTNSEFDQIELWNLLSDQVKKGRIKHLGISIVNSLVLTDDISQIEKATKVNAEVVQVVYNRLNRKAEELAFPSCQRQNLGVIARVPLAKGHLTGKYKPDFRFPQNDKRFSDDREQTRKQLESVQEIKKNEVPENMNMAQWALGWCLQHNAISTVIPGCKNLEQLEFNAQASDLDMISEKHPLSWL